ncbi:MAG: S1 RNA-binding domain-containing protein, partial [Acidobacteriota bacterium]|nr:S1 RNA-binding domain-containing protein [Acidobacteriota bacterium]
TPETTPQEAPVVEPKVVEPKVVAEGEPPAKANAPVEAQAPAEKAAPAKPKVSAAQASLYRALRSSRPMRGQVEKVIKGGFEIRIGKTRGFCPRSQMDLQPITDAESYVGKDLPFRITQVRRGGDDVVVSRRAILQAEQVEEAKAVRGALLDGQIVQGRVISIAAFGAFVDLGAGVQGLIHLSELSHQRVSRVEDATKVGETVSVKILKIEESGKRISLSMRQAVADPWDSVGERFPAGTRHSGTVRRVADFGAFVELADGVEALAPASEFPPSRLAWETQAPVGEAKDWWVLSVDPGRRRISVTLATDEGQVHEKLEVGQEISGKVQRLERFGVFVWLGPGRVALMPSMWTGTARGADLSRNFTGGDSIDVTVVEIADDGKRIRVARKGVSTETPQHEPRTKRRERREPRSQERVEMPPPSPDDGSFGSLLADKLKAALDS